MKAVLRDRGGFFRGGYDVPWWDLNLHLSNLRERFQVVRDPCCGCAQQDFFFGGPPCVEVHRWALPHDVFCLCQAEATPARPLVPAAGRVGFRVMARAPLSGHVGRWRGAGATRSQSRSWMWRHGHPCAARPEAGTAHSPRCPSAQRAPSRSCPPLVFANRTRCRRLLYATRRRACAMTIGTRHRR